MTDNYIDLKVNGRLFPVWVLHNFKKYRLPPIVRDNDADPCQKPVDTRELRNYQKFLASYMDYRSPYRNILVYHGLGSGKTVTAINVYNMLYNYTPLWNVFILIKASLKDDPWLKDLRSWIPKNDKDDRMNNIYFIHYDAPNADKVFLNKLKEVDANKKNMYIIDEAHNFIKNVYNNIVSGYGRRAFTIYDYIVTEKKESDHTRVILLSGTPAVNNPYELALMFNLLRPDIFPKTETQFNDIYISNKGGRMVLNQDNKNLFQRRTLGLVSYYIGADPQLFASKHVIKKYLPMDKYQEKVYGFFEKIEEQLEKKRMATNAQQTLYSSYTRQASNFVFPSIGEEINGENRPRPSKFNLNLGESKLIVEGKSKKLLDLQKAMEKKKQAIKAYLQTIEKYTTSFEGFLDKIAEEDRRLGHTIQKDIEAFKSTYKMKFSAFWKEAKKSKLLETMYACSCKMTAILFYMMRSKGPVIIYSNYVKMEGLEIMKIYLKYVGFTGFTDKQSKDYHRYVEYHGDIDRDVRTSNLKNINLPENVDGKIIKIIMISAAGSEGINLLNIRQVHIMEPYWNEVRIKQLIGRAVRMCSHKQLPMEERKVDVYRYHAVRGTDGSNKITTDQRIANMADEKEGLIDSFLQSVREVAVDCELFKEHNMIDSKYDCFRFEDAVLFEKFIGPAYKDDLYYDQKINNGTNNTNTVKKKIKVVKISGVIKQGKAGHSAPAFFWFDPESGIVYDYELDYPIGRMFKREKLDDKTYIIEEVIPIPKLNRV
jgi:superfamily II DNA or RNA helicase